ncbi:phospholipase D/nuclease [Setomelanomma holmii]|uniref:Phospholipase D/nuclease n=1 Tax=Setomelanomma holmii TaxID=210430 RepID=A0A9P4LSY2_9PLEO|nr:phospholipase D/nuclease [Setomelanomma holmii]
MATPQDSPPAKRRKLHASPPEEAAATASQDVLQGLARPISPPVSRRRSPAVQGSTAVLMPTGDFGDVAKQASPTAATTPTPDLKAEEHTNKSRDGQGEGVARYAPSPIQLTTIEDMAPHQNVDAVSLKDVLGDPMIKECWNFNYLFDLNFVMKQFDEDVRNLVKVKIVHGFWKSEDPNRIRLFETAEQHPNIELLPAYLPDAFGTHHSKMLILFRHDHSVQVVIHTANMIYRDWSNMTQAVWRSPLLPLLPATHGFNSADADPSADVHPIGGGERFKVDLIRYFKAYGKRLISLNTQLMAYDFSAVKAAFIGSAPSRRKPTDAQSSKQTSFGWLGLQETLSTIPVTLAGAKQTSSPHIVVQISSIATLGAAPNWLRNFQSVLGRSTRLASATQSGAYKFFSKSAKEHTPEPRFNIIFPTPEEIRTSLDGWASGGSIHMKLQSQQQQKQLEYLLPLFCHWKTPSESDPPARHGEALRGPAAPHIKTYIRYTDQTHKTIDWAMVTSANLSKQAWGDVVNKKDEIWIQSYEAGVVIWPALLAAEGAAEKTVMVPVFGRDMPCPEDVLDTDEEKNGMVVGFRMPYDLPLSPYKSEDQPWCATMQYPEPDWKGMSWGGY